MMLDWWDLHFLWLASAIGERYGTCDRGRAGCAIVSGHKVLAIGAVGVPKGVPTCDDAGHIMKTYPHEDGKYTRHCVRTIHAELNALVQAARDGTATEGATIYCRMVPCEVCAKAIINAGIVKVVTQKDYHASEESKRLFQATGVELLIATNDTQNYEDM